MTTTAKCPKCGCQTLDPFGMGKVIHDIEACNGISRMAECQEPTDAPDVRPELKQPSVEEPREMVVDETTCSADLLGGVGIVMPQGLMGPGNDYLVDSIIRAIAVSHAEEGEWASKYGTNIETDKFMMHRFCWCEMDNCPWCWDEEERGEQKPNFHYKPTDFRVSWYKYIGRGMTMNRQISIEECSRILADCIKTNQVLHRQDGTHPPL